MDEERRRFGGIADAILTVVAVILLAVVAMLVMNGCTIHDGYVRPSIAVSGGYYSPGYGDVSVEIAVPPVYPGYGYYGYDPYDYPGYHRYYPPRAVNRRVYRRSYYPPPVVYKRGVVRHHHHPAYRQHVATAPERQWRRPVRPPVYRRPVATAERDPRSVPQRRRRSPRSQRR